MKPASSTPAARPRPDRPRQLILLASLCILGELLLIAFPAARAGHATDPLPPPLLPATQAWERGSLDEPVPLRWQGRDLLLYTAGWDHGAIGVAWSTDGSHWTKHSGPVFGLGGSGYAGLAAEPAIAEDGGTLILYYATMPTSSLYAATSRDGVHWTRRPVPVLRTTSGYIGLANTAVVRTGHGWAMLFESMTPSGMWRMGLARSADPYHWRVVAWPLQALDMGGAYGGPWLDRTGQGWQVLYHASTAGDLGTNLYQSTSADLLHWTRPALYLRYPNISGIDQAADPSLLGGHLIYSLCDNAARWCALHER